MAGMDIRTIAELMGTQENPDDDAVCTFGSGSQFGCR
jgi:hypothetical protein